MMPAKLAASGLFKPIRHVVGHTVSAPDSFVCCGSIRDLEKVKFSENS